MENIIIKIKNYKGDIYYSNGAWFAKSKIKNNYIMYLMDLSKIAKA